MSENSSARTWVIDWDRAETTNGIRSVTPPGWMPVPWMVEPPLAAGRLDGRLVPAAGKEPAQRGHHVLARASSRATTAGSAMIGE